MAGDDAGSTPDLGDYGASVTIDSSGRVRQVTATVAGVGPFEYSPDGSSSAPAQPGAPQTTAAHDARLRHDIDLLQQAVQHLHAQADAAGIAHAVVTVMAAANAAVHSTEWVESEGLAEETRHWTAVTGSEGALETFEAARGHVTTAAEHLAGVLNQLFGNHDLVGRSIQRGARGGEALTYLAQLAAYGRVRLTFTTAGALHLLDEAIRNLEQASSPDLVVRDVLSTISMTNNAMLGTQHWDQALSTEYREWLSLGEHSGTAERFQHARDQFLPAARDARRDLGAWQNRRMDHGAVAGIAHGLVDAAQRARTGITAP